MDFLLLFFNKWKSHTTLKEWEENFDELFTRVENGERLGIVKEESTYDRYYYF